MLIKEGGGTSEMRKLFLLAPLNVFPVSIYLYLNSKGMLKYYL